MWSVRLSIPLLSAGLVVHVPEPAGAAEPMTEERSPTDQRSRERRDVSEGHTRARSLLGREVRSNDDERLGTIDEIVVDPQTSAVIYVVVSSGGTVGIGDKKHAVPWHALTIDDERIVLGVSQHTFMQTRGFDGDWPDSANFALAPDDLRARAVPAERGAEMDRSPAAAPESQAAPPPDANAERAAELRENHPYGLTGGAGLDAARRHRSSASPEHREAEPTADEAAARETREAARSAAMDRDAIIKPLDREHLWSHRASDLAGLAVVRDDGRRIGEVEDLVIDDAAGRIEYALLDLAGTIGAGGRKALVPWEAVRLNLADRTLSVEADEEAIRQAAFEDGKMPDLNDPQWIERTRRAFNGGESGVFGYSIQTDAPPHRDDPPQAPREE